MTAAPPLTADPGHPAGPATPAWAMTGDDLLAELDDLHAAVSRLQLRRLEVLARFDELGHAKQLGARHTIELLSLRHRLDEKDVRRDEPGLNTEAGTQALHDYRNRVWAWAVPTEVPADLTPAEYIEIFPDEAPGTATAATATSRWSRAWVAPAGREVRREHRSG